MRLDRILLSGLVLLAASVVGCGGGGSKPTQPKAPVTPEKSEEEKAAERKAKRLAGIKSGIKSVQDAIKGKDVNWERVQSVALGLKAEALGTKHEKEAAALVAETKDAFELAGENEYLELLAKAEIEAAKGYWEDAESVLSQFESREIYKGTEIWEVWEEKRLEFMRASAAEVLSKDVLREAKGLAEQLEYGRAVAVLSAFSDQYSSTEYYERVQVAMDEYLALYKEDKEEQKAETSSAVFVEVESIGDFARAEPDPDVTVWEWDEDEQAARGKNRGEKHASINLGEENWDDYVVEFRVKVEGDPLLHIGVTSQKRFGENQYPVYKFADVSSDEWYHLRIEVKNGSVEFVDIEAEDYIRGKARKKLPTGGIAFFCMPGQTVFIKDVRYKVYTKAEEPKEDEGEGDDSGDDGDDDGEDDGDR